MFKQNVKWVRIGDSLGSVSDRTPMNRVTVIHAEGYAICIGKNKDGLFAVRNKCPHEGYSFEGGWCTDAGKMVCPVHRYGFDVETGRGAGTYVRVYRLVEKSDGLYAGIEYTSLF